MQPGDLAGGCVVTKPATLSDSIASSLRMRDRGWELPVRNLEFAPVESSGGSQRSYETPSAGN